MTLLVCLIGALAFGVSACGGDDDDEGGGGGGGGISGSKLTVYSSLPLQGSNRPQSLNVIQGARLALKQHGGKVGKFTIDYKPLDDATAAAGKWDPGATSANARRAAQDDTTICYLGEFNSGASAISIPLLNEAGIQQISPSNTALELTKDAGPDDKGAPEKYYPTGKRTYARVVPADHIQGAAQADWMKERGVKKLYVTDDKEVYGSGVAKTTSDAAKLRDIEVVDGGGIDPKAPNYRAIGEKVAESGADAFFFGGIVENHAAQLFKDVAAANPDIELYGPDGVAVSTFTEDLPAEIQPRTFLTVAVINPKDYPAEGQRFYDAFEKEYNNPKPEPYAIYGYEAMDLCLDAIKRAGAKGNDRQAVIDQVFATKDKVGVAGTYDIDADGDVDLNTFGRHLVKNGELSPIKTVKVAEDSNGEPLGR
jgi:branched-chain amino acid transport system substrate-binding protein